MCENEDGVMCAREKICRISRIRVYVSERGQGHVFKGEGEGEGMWVIQGKGMRARAKACVRG